MPVIRALLLAALVALPLFATNDAAADPPCVIARENVAGIVVTFQPPSAWCGGPRVTVDACADVDGLPCYVALP